MSRQNRIVRQTAFGGPEHITVENAPIPHPEPGQAVVRVHYAGLNPVDWKVAADPELAAAFSVEVPGGYGHDFAGVVSAVGDGVDSFSVGDRVMGGARGSAIADYVAVSADTLQPVPDAVTLDIAATLPIAGRTAAAAISRLGLGEDDTVLVGGAAGGVGQIATQLAVRTGATVVATASAANHDFLRELGAIPVLYGDGLAERVRAATDRPLTAASDLQGRDAAQAAIDLGVDPGRITQIADEPLPGAIGTGGGGAPAGTIRRLLDDIAEGDLRVFIAGEYPIERTAEAVARLREGHVRGKLVISTGA